MRANTIPTLDPDILYEECPDCPPGGGCLTCFDECLVPHACEGEEDA